MSIKRIGAVIVVAGAVMFPLAACGSSSTPAPTVTVTSAPSTLSPGFKDSYCNINSATKAACQQSDATAKQRAATAQPAPRDSGLPWWAWLLIVPAGLVALLVLGIKLAEANDERTIARANARVYELESRPRPILDYDDYEDDEDDELDELPEDDIDFLHRVTDPAPSAPAPSTSTAGGNLLSSLRQQGGGVQ